MLNTSNFILNNQFQQIYKKFRKNLLDKELLWKYDNDKLLIIELPYYISYLIKTFIKKFIFYNYL